MTPNIIELETDGSCWEIDGCTSRRLRCEGNNQILNVSYKNEAYKSNSNIRKSSICIKSNETKQLQAFLKLSKTVDSLKNNTTLKDATLKELSELKDNKEGATKMRQLIIALFDDPRYKEVKAVSTHKTLSEKEEVADQYYWCSYLKKSGDTCNKAKASPKGMYNHRIECRHRSRGDHSDSVEQTGNIGTKNEPNEATFKCIKKKPIIDKRIVETL
jgi:hypothetical protein